MTSATIVIPCFNEAKRLPMGRIVDYLRAPHAARLLFVDDGSTDDTLAVLEEVREAHASCCGLLRLAGNVGKGEAVRRGIVAALQDDPLPEFVGFWDADLSTPLEAIASFVDFARDHPHLEMLLGSRVRMLGRNIERQYVRHYLGRAVATVISLALGLPVYDTQCGAKLFRVDPSVQALFARPFLTRWLFDVEILARWIQAARRDGLRPAEEIAYEMPLQEWRHMGDSNVSALDFFRAGLDLVRIWRAYLR